MSEHAEHANWHVSATVQKWNRSEDHDAGLDPDEVVEAPHNLLCNAGITRMLNLLVGAGGTAFNSTNSRIGVGNGTTAAAAANTDLAGASKYFKLVDSVSVSGQTATWVATYGTSDANFAWEEWGIDNGATSGATVTAPLLNRRVTSMGTKSSGSTWTLTVTITVS